MKIGEYLVTKVHEERNITCGDGVVGKFIINPGEKYKITDIIKDQIEIDFNGIKLWFATSIEEPQYFVEDYRLYFYDYTKMSRKLKLNNIDEK